MDINENVIDYKYKFPTIDILFTKNNDNDNENYKKDKSYYFILDSNASRDFGYWIFESFIFISLLKDLNKTNPNIKIITKIKNYDIKELLHYFNVDNEIVNEIDNYNNICYSPPNVNKYNYAFINFDHNNETIKKIKMNANVNANANDICFINNHENIKNNLSVINNAKIIILLYDPSFYYNCIFLENKIIIVIDENDDVYRPNGIGTHINSNTFLDHLFKIISSKNKVQITKLDNVLRLF